MTPHTIFGQWTFYGILGIVILFISQSLLQAAPTDVGMPKFASAYEKFNQKMAKFKQLTHEIEANEDPDAVMLKIVRKNLDEIRQILESLEPIRGVVVALEPGISIGAYRGEIHKLTVLLWGQTKRSTAKRATKIQKTYVVYVNQDRINRRGGGTNLFWKKIFFLQFSKNMCLEWKTLFLLEIVFF